MAVNVTKTLVASETQAQALGFVSSPTIRVNGLDIAGELVESACDSCSDTCACNGGVDCRHWLWRGEHTQEPPLGLIVEAIMRHAGCWLPEGKAACCGNPVAGAACGCQA